MKRNKFSKALKHLKSKKIDEKIKSLEEAAPTNNMSGVYQVTPSTSGDGFRMGKLDPAKKFYPKADGTWPAGIPADPSDRVYVRGAGYHTGKGAIPDSQNNTPRDLSLAYMNANGNDTTTMIRASDGAVYADLPEGTRNFILGPLVTSYTQNHTSDDFTNLGYIQKDTRQFVLLGRIQGFLDGAKRLNGAARTWDGTATQFISYNSNFTIEHALWMRDNYNAGNFTANVPFNLSGGIPADRHPDDPSKGGGDVLGTDGGPAGSDSDDDGKNQDPADENDIESLDLWGLIKDVLDDIGDRFKGVLGVLDAIPPFLNFLVHQVNPNSPWTDDKPFDIKINEAEADAVRNDIEEIFNEWGNDRVDEINEGSPMTREEQNQINEKINRNKTDSKYTGDALNAEYAGYRLTINNIGKPDAFEGNIQTNSDGTRTPTAIDDNYVFEGDADASAPGAPDIIKFMLELPGVQSAIEKSGLDYPYRKDNESPIDDFGTKEEIKNKNMPVRLNLTTTNSLLRRESFNFNRKKILREIRQPLKEIKELPKTTKLKGYRPNFKGRFSPQNTPDVTASKKSDDIVSAKNASRQVWTAKDKFWKGYETTERMNIIYDNLGHGSQYFDRIVDENVRQKSKKSREVQEHLNMLAHQKAMREVYGIKEYENFIDESETFDNKINDPLFTKVAKRLKKEIDYPMKPAAKGYPNEEPPKIDPNTGMHPKFGKRYKYDKLDPISAKTMAGAPTGDPEIDANVKRQAQKEDWRSDLKNLWLGSERGDWKKKIEEDFVNSTQGMKVGQTFTHVPSGETVTTSGVLGGIETLQTNVPIFGDEIPGPNATQYGLQGFAKPIDMMRRGNKKAEQLNKELDSSEDYTKEIKADEFMKARVDDELEKLKKILDEKTKKLDDLNKKISELNKLAAKQSKKISKMRDDGLKKIDAKYNERNNVRDEMVRKFEASFPSLTYTIGGSMQIKDKADSDRYYKEQGDFYKKVDATWESMTKKIDAERKTFLEKMDKLSSSTTGKYNQEIFNLTQYELPTAEAQYDEALKNHSDKLLEKNKLNQEQNMLKGMIDEVTSMFASYFRKQLGGGLPLPVELTLRYAMGNMDPLTKSPGTLFNAITMKAITNAFNTKSNTVNAHHYHSMDERLVQAAYNNFSYQVTPNGIRVMDTFNFDDPDAGGTTIGAFKVIPGAQWLATQLVKAGDRNARSKGIDPRDDRFGIKVDYTIPKSDLTPEQIKLFYGKSKASTDRTGYGYDTKGKLDSSGYGMDPNRDTETQARPIKPSKTVTKIKGLAGEKARKELSLDQPIVSPKKKKS